MLSISPIKKDYNSLKLLLMNAKKDIIVHKNVVSQCKKEML